MEGMMCVFAGNPIHGMELFGPFKTPDAAISWAETDCPYDEWWLVTLQEPKELEDKA